MFVRIVSIPVIDRTFNELDLIREDIKSKVFPVLIRQDGWIRTDVIYSRITKKIRTISYWESKEQADVFEEEKPHLTSLQYMQYGQFAEYFDSAHFEIEYFELLDTLEKQK